MKSRSGYSRFESSCSIREGENVRQEITMRNVKAKRGRICRSAAQFYSQELRIRRPFSRDRCVQSSFSFPPVAGVFLCTTRGQESRRRRKERMSLRSGCIQLLGSAIQRYVSRDGHRRAMSLTKGGVGRERHRVRLGGSGVPH